MQCAEGKEPNTDSTACEDDDTLDGDVEKTDLQTWKQISIVVGISLAGALAVIVVFFIIKRTRLAKNWKRSRELQTYAIALMGSNPKWDDKDWLGEENPTTVNEEEKTVGDVAAAIAAARGRPAGRAGREQQQHRGAFAGALRWAALRYKSL
jgi:hypothetical protein